MSSTQQENAEIVLEGNKEDEITPTCSMGTNCDQWVVEGHLSPEEGYAQEIADHTYVKDRKEGQQAVLAVIFMASKEPPQI